MMPGRFSRLMAFAVLAGLVSGCSLSSCAPDIKIEGRGQKIAEGRYSGLQVGRTGTSEEEDPFILALRDPDTTGGTLTVIPFGQGETCDIGWAQYYRISGTPHTDGTTITNREARIPFIETHNGPMIGTLRFADLDCNLKPPVLQNAMAGIWSVPDSEHLEVVGFLAIDVNDDLYFLDPWNEVSTLLAESVSFYTIYEEQLWLLEQGQLVVRQMDGTEVARIGTDVRWITMSWNRSEVALVEGTDLYILEDLGHPLVPIESDTCEPQYISNRPNLLAYFSPCHQRRLVFLDRDTGERTIYADGIGAWRRLGDWLFYITGAAGSFSVGELWAVPPAGSPIKIGNDASLWNIGLLPEDRFLVLLDVQDGKGRLGTWRIGQEFSEIAQNVSRFTTSYERLTLLTDSDGITGTLSILDLTDFAVELTVPNISVNTYRFSLYAPALGYLEEYDADQKVGILKVYIIPTRDTVEVDVNVAEFRELYWPDWGVLYTIGTGDPIGIYFSKVVIE